MKSIKKKLMIIAAMLIGVGTAFGADGLKEHTQSAESRLAKKRYQLVVGQEFKKPVPKAALAFRTNEAKGIKWHGIKSIYAYNKAAVKR